MFKTLHKVVWYCKVRSFSLMCRTSHISFCVRISTCPAFPSLVIFIPNLCIVPLCPLTTRLPKLSIWTREIILLTISFALEAPIWCSFRGAAAESPGRRGCSRCQRWMFCWRIQEGLVLGNSFKEHLWQRLPDGFVILRTFLLLLLPRFCHFEMLGDSQSFRFTASPAECTASTCGELAGLQRNEKCCLFQVRRYNQWVCFEGLCLGVWPVGPLWPFKELTSYESTFRTHNPLHGRQGLTWFGVSRRTSKSLKVRRKRSKRPVALRSGTFWPLLKSVGMFLIWPLLVEDFF